jgi:hypothetical protein
MVNRLMTRQSRDDKLQFPDTRKLEGVLLFDCLTVALCHAEGLSQKDAKRSVIAKIWYRAMQGGSNHLAFVCGG